MKLRNKKLLSLLLATAMVFTMNTSVFALEVGEDADEEYTVDFVDDSGDFEESEGAAEVDSVETDDFAFVDEIDGLNVDSEGIFDSDESKATSTSINKLGWTIGGSEVNLEFTTVNVEKKTVELGGKVSLTGDIKSEDITIDPDIADEGDFSLKVSETDDDVAANVVVTLLSSDTVATSSKLKSGYAYISGYKGDSKEKLAEWAKDLTGNQSIKVDVNDSNLAKADDNGDMKIVLTFSFSKESAEASNKLYGYDEKTIGTTHVEYYKNIPFCGKGTIKTNLANAFGITVSSGNTKFTVKSVSVKFTKGSTNATITKIKLNGGDKKTRKAAEKALKKQLTLTCYPYNLSAGGYTNRKVNKKNTKLTVKINGKKISVTNGKSDKFGGTPKLTASNNKILVENSKILTGLG